MAPLLPRKFKCDSFGAEAQCSLALTAVSSYQGGVGGLVVCSQQVPRQAMLFRSFFSLEMGSCLVSEASFELLGTSDSSSANNWNYTYAHCAKTSCVLVVKAHRLSLVSSQHI